MSILSKCQRNPLNLCQNHFNKKDMRAKVSQKIKKKKADLKYNNMPGTHS